MRLVAQFESKAAPPTASPVTRQPRFRHSCAFPIPGLGALLVGAGVLFAAISPALQAEELAPYLQAAGYGPLLASAYAPAQPAAAVLRPAPEPAAASFAEPSQFTNQSQIKSLFQPAAREEVPEFDTDFVLVQTRMHSRFAYDSQAALETGYGQFFPDDKIGRSRTSGAGIQDPDWFYLKISLRF